MTTHSLGNYQVKHLHSQQKNAAVYIAEPRGSCPQALPHSTGFQLMSTLICRCSFTARKSSKLPCTGKSLFSEPII